MDDPLPAPDSRRHALPLWLSGSGMALAALPHGLAAGPAFLRRVAALGADDALRGALAAGWWFGTTMMLASAALVMGQAWRVHRGGRADPAVLGPLAIAWLGFGLAAFVLRDFATHYLGFIACGALLAWATRRTR